MAAREFSFTSFQANNPTAPPPGDRLDGEFDRLARTLAAQAPPPPAKIGKNQLEPGLFDQIGASILARVEALAASAQTLLGEARAIALGTLAAAGVARAQNALAQDAAQRSTTEAQAASSSAADAAASAGQAEAFYVETGNAARDTAGDVATCQAYADVTYAWAEHMPDPIPPNILAVMGITGNHWSSRWWANQAALAVAGGIGNWVAGSVAFATSPTTLGQDSANFCWDDVNNRLGIGTAAPASPLHVVAPAGVHAALVQGNAADTHLRLESLAAVAATNTATLDLAVQTSAQTRTVALVQAALTTTADATRTGDLVIQTVNSGTLAEKMRVTGPGNVGIGQTSPRAGLHVGKGGGVPAIGAAGTVGNAGTYLSGADGSYGLLFGSSNTGDQWVQAQRVDGTATTYNIDLQPNGGNVGIGTTGPGAKLHVSSATDVSTVALISGTARGIRLGIDGAGNAAISGVDNTGSASFQPLVVGGSTTTLSAGGTAALTVAVGGNIGIGTAGPTQKLTVATATTTSPVGILVTNGSGAQERFLLGAEGSTTGALASGSIPYAAVLNDADGHGMQFATGNTVRVNLYFDGGVTIAAPTGASKGSGTLNAVGVYANNVILTSDQNLKTDIAPLSAALPILVQIEPKTFRWKPLPDLPGFEDSDPTPSTPPDFTTRLNRGFLAQDVAKAIGGDGDTVDLGSLVAILWQAVREMNEHINARETGEPPPASAAAKGRSGER